MIVKQPDTSTSIAIALIFISLLFIAGLSYKIVLTVLGICIPTGLIGITVILRMAQSSGDYRFGRIMAWLYPQDPRWSDIAAQQQNSIMAIGSGQLWGKGLNNSAATSMKNANYIIEPQTDFIFAVAGEELGFIGTMVIVLLLLFIVIECILIARKAKDLAGRLICCGMAALIGFQSIFNIFVATGLMPNTGIPLPFVSYGLTSLLSLYLGMGFVLNVGLGRYTAIRDTRKIELALVKLYRVTGKERYLEMAGYFIDARGQGENYFLKEIKSEKYKLLMPEFVNYDPVYSQSDLPVREQQKAEGHAVRAVYMYSAMADLACEYEDKTLFDACSRLWKNIVNKQMYITGSIGSSGILERFTTDYDLPNDYNYSESCASIGLAMFGKRMADITKDASYMDTVERALYNKQYVYC